MLREWQKNTGSYYTPDAVARSLVRWAVRAPADRILDPSCGDGRFLQFHRSGVGVEQDAGAVTGARARAPWAQIHEEDLFTWARETSERFEALVGNPPFIRYQRFSGEIRERALDLCASLGVRFSSLTSSWAPFLVAAANLLKAGGRMAFVVPAEIGHAPYAVPLLEFLLNRFQFVQVVPVQEKLFPELAEDCWLLYAEGYGSAADFIKVSPIRRFRPTQSPPNGGPRVGIAEWGKWGHRLRPFVLPAAARELYRAYADDLKLPRLGDFAKVGIGYVTGDNEFFHLRPSTADRLGIPRDLLSPAVRNGRALSGESLTNRDVDAWLRDDEPVLLLRLEKGSRLSDPVRRYLATPAAKVAQEGYKCRNRDPWYVVPDVTVPDGFLSYMSGENAMLVANDAGCVCTNSVHAVTLKASTPLKHLQRRWRDPLTELSRELQGHPLGGGMLKLEPREATSVMLGNGGRTSKGDCQIIRDAIDTMRKWRHYG